MKRREADGHFVAWCGLGRNFVSFCFPLSLAPGLTEAFLGVRRAHFYPRVPRGSGLLVTSGECARLMEPALYKGLAQC